MVLILKTLKVEQHYDTLTKKGWGHIMIEIMWRYMDGLKLSCMIFLRVEKKEAREIINLEGPITSLKWLKRSPASITTIFVHWHSWTIDSEIGRYIHFNWRFRCTPSTDLKQHQLFLWQNCYFIRAIHHILLLNFNTIGSRINQINHAMGKDI